MTDQADLQALSDAATQGEWRREEGPGAWNSGGIETTDGYPIVITGPDGDIPNEADRAYIVALVNAHREGRLADSPSPDTDREPWDEADGMCPNCVTPWKCNGPHLIEETVAAKRAGLRPSPDTDAGLDVAALRKALFEAFDSEDGHAWREPETLDLFTSEVAEVYARLATTDKDQPELPFGRPSGRDR